VQQVAPGERLYREPATTFVAGFLGDPLMLEGTVDRGVLRVGEEQLTVAGDVPPGPAAAVLRPEWLDLARPDADRSRWDNALPGVVRFASFDGAGTFYQVKLDLGPAALVHLPARDGRARFGPGEQVLVVWHSSEVPVVPTGA
jgi:putative spermidine/putrescine transport system ATP-binding protein